MLERLSGDPYWKRSIMHFCSPFFMSPRDMLWGQAVAHLRVASCLYRFPVLRVLVLPWLRGGGLLSPAAPEPVQCVCAVRTCVCVHRWETLSCSLDKDLCELQGGAQWGQRTRRRWAQLSLGCSRFKSPVAQSSDCCSRQQLIKQGGLPGWRPASQQCRQSWTSRRTKEWSLPTMGRERGKEPLRSVPSCHQMRGVRTARRAAGDGASSSPHTSRQVLQGWRE